MTGHGLGAAGGIEAVATVLAMTQGFLPPTANYDEADPECDLDYARVIMKVEIGLFQENGVKAFGELFYY